MPTEPTHTPGKLRALIHGNFGDVALESESRRCVAMCDTNFGKLSREEVQGNALRLAACWNACEAAGLSTEALEDDGLARLIKAAAFAATAISFRYGVDSGTDKEAYKDAEKEYGGAAAKALLDIRQAFRALGLSAAQPAADPPAEDPTR